MLTVSRFGQKKKQKQKKTGGTEALLQRLPERCGGRGGHPARLRLAFGRLAGPAAQGLTAARTRQTPTGACCFPPLGPIAPAPIRVEGLARWWRGERVAGLQLGLVVLFVPSRRHNVSRGSTGRCPQRSAPQHPPSLRCPTDIQAQSHRMLSAGTRCRAQSLPLLLISRKTTLISPFRIVCFQLSQQQQQQQQQQAREEAIHSHLMRELPTPPPAHQSYMASSMAHPHPLQHQVKANNTVPWDRNLAKMTMEMWPKNRSPEFQSKRKTNLGYRSLIDDRLLPQHANYPQLLHPQFIRAYNDAA